MSDGSNSSNSTIEDTNMASPSQASGTSTPAQAHNNDSDSNMTPAGQDTPSNLTPGHVANSAVVSPAGAQSVETQQQQPQGSPMSSAPSTPSNKAGLAKAAEPSSSATIASTSTTTAQSSSQPTQRDEQLQQQQNQEQQLLLLQKQAQAQAQAQAHLAQLQLAHAASLGSNPAAVASVAQHSLAVGAALQSRKEEELNRKDRTLAEFLPMMENYNPIIPDAVTDYYLSRTGFDCDDVRIKRLLALAAQKFVSDIATDAFQYCKVRQQSQKRAAPGKEKKTVLTMEDLSDALGEYGINVKKPDYFM
ncbi:Transcription initiation factor TFIID subunit 10 [Mortierella sp. AD011]|nr:Transcription initiation factor TFIID subunit 10 [Mortierella sp. AD010]KAF9395756.1 Transcription initiation factor TFIID subunit 10 [Mortierella sp. AD011]